MSIRDNPRRRCEVEWSRDANASSLILHASTDNSSFATVNAFSDGHGKTLGDPTKGIRHGILYLSWQGEGMHRMITVGTGL